MRTVVAGIAVVVAVLAACKRQDPQATNSFGTSLIFDEASPEAREALASTVDFRVTDENFARWEQAQANLDRLPRSAIAAGAAPGGSAIDRAVTRLESSPRARTAIESADMSVRDFVLATIALAQATEAMQRGTSAGRSAVVEANSRFVSQYQSSVLRSRSRAYARGQAAPSFDVQPGMANEEAAAGVQPEPGQIQQLPQEQGEPRRQADSVPARDDRLRVPARADSSRDSVPAVRRDTLLRY